MPEPGRNHIDCHDGDDQFCLGGGVCGPGKCQKFIIEQNFYCIREDTSYKDSCHRKSPLIELMDWLPQERMMREMYKQDVTRGTKYRSEGPRGQLVSDHIAEEESEESLKD